MPSDRGRRTSSFKKMRLRVLSTSDICWLCGQPGSTTVDHVIPLSLAPDLAEDITNLRPAHLRCNSKRGARLTDGSTAMPASRRW